MVRLKDRYLLVTIIYSDAPSGNGQGQGQQRQKQQQQPVSDLLLFNQPTTSELKPQLLLKGIRSQVNALFGDCGSGAVDRSLQGELVLQFFSYLYYTYNTRCVSLSLSQII